MIKTVDMDWSLSPHTYNEGFKTWKSVRGRNVLISVIAKALHEARLTSEALLDVFGKREDSSLDGEFQNSDGDDEAEKAEAIKDIQEFIGAFRGYLVATYAGVFTQYTWNNIIINSII